MMMYLVNIFSICLGNLLGNYKNCISGVPTKRQVQRLSEFSFTILPIIIKTNHYIIIQKVFFQKPTIQRPNVYNNKKRNELFQRKHVMLNITV